MPVIEHTENIVLKMPFDAVLQLLTNGNESLTGFRLESIDVNSDLHDQHAIFFLARNLPT